MSEPCALDKQPRLRPEAPRTKYVGGVQDGKHTQLFVTKASSEERERKSIGMEMTAVGAQGPFSYLA